MSFFSILLALSIFASNAYADYWNGYNSPANMDITHTYEYNLYKLPLKAQLDMISWSETYWPTYMGSINQRWNTPCKDGFNYYPPSKSQVLQMGINLSMVMNSNF